MAKNGFSTTTVWSAGNSEAFKVCPKRCTHAIFDVVYTKVHSDSLTQIPAITEVHYNYIHNNYLPMILQQFN